MRQIRRLIEKGKLRPGDRLAGERQLSEQLQVSRATVREALQFLQAMGHVEIRHGEGTFVRTSFGDARRLRLEWREWIARHRGRVRELLEVREAQETFAAELAAERLRAEGLEQMEDALRQMEAGAADRDVTALVQADLLFHDGLVRSAGNAVLRDLAETLGQQLIQERAALWDLPGRPERSLREHRQIYEAIRAQDARRARLAVREHIASVRRDMEVHVIDHRDEEA
ncbi:MAG: FadR/GntR family transcriptional regulator [Armatimonadota bacterium]